MGIIKKFRCTYEELILVLRVLVNNCIDNLTDIVKEKPKYKEPFFQDMMQRIDDIDVKYLGVDSAADMRKATANLYSIMSPAKDDFTKFQKNIYSDFNKDKAKADEILNTLGFNKYYSSAVHNGNQENMSTLLKQFVKYLTPELEAVIVGKGMNLELITRIKGYAATMPQANTTQEDTKIKRPEITSEAVNAFNDIYDDAMAAIDVVKDIFKKDKVKKDLFSFSKVLKNIRGGNRNGGSDNGGDQTPPTPPPTN